MAILNYQPPTEPYLEVLHQDDDIVVLNKPSGLLSVPGKHPDHADSLMHRVQRVWPNAGIVHRLDMMTSGIMIMAMHKQALRFLNREFSERNTEKTYIAKVFGHVKEDQGSIDLPLICDWPNRPKQKVCYETGKASLTHYKVLERSSSDTCKWTKIELTPITGRSHQLRVHLNELGHPILGDRLYAPDSVIAMADRLLLHAQILSVQHPQSGNKMTFEYSCEF